MGGVFFAPTLLNRTAQFQQKINPKTIAHFYLRYLNRGVAEKNQKPKKTGKNALKRCLVVLCSVISGKFRIKKWGGTEVRQEIKVGLQVHHTTNSNCSRLASKERKDKVDSQNFFHNSHSVVASNFINTFCFIQ